jgi:hypothetical protein
MSHYLNQVQLSVNPCSSVKPSYIYQSMLCSLITWNGMHFHGNCFALHQMGNNFVQTFLFTAIRIIIKKNSCQNVCYALKGHFLCYM